MTIADLITHLHQLPPKLEVYVYDDWYDCPLAPPTVDDIDEPQPDVPAGYGLARPRRLVVRREP